MDAGSGSAQFDHPVSGWRWKNLAEGRANQSPPVGSTSGAAMNTAERTRSTTTNFGGENFMRRLTIFAALMLAALLVCLPALAQDMITTAIGGGPNGIPAIDANLYNPYGVAVDAAGNAYIAAYNQNRVFKVNPAGTITVLAGSGAQGYTGDGVVAERQSRACTILLRWRSTRPHRPMF